MLALFGLVTVAAASFPEEFRNATHFASVFADLDAPKFLPARARAAAPALDAVVAFLRGDAVDVKGHGGAPLPADLDPGAALAGDARVSFVARLERFAAAASSQALKTLGLPGSVADYDAGDTVHVYASAPGASALANHTDTADVLVHQVLGRKTWFVCASAADESPKLGTCATYGDDEVEPFLDSCSTLTLGPGDSLLLPRRSLHSARAYDDAPSVHVTVGFRSLVDGGCEDVADSTPALVRALPEALASPAAKDLAAAAIPADVDVNVLVESPLFGAAAAVALELEEAPEEWAGYCEDRGWVNVAEVLRAAGVDHAALRFASPDRAPAVAVAAGAAAAATRAFGAPRDQRRALLVAAAAVEQGGGTASTLWLDAGAARLDAAPGGRFAPCRNQIFNPTSM